MVSVRLLRMWPSCHMYKVCCRDLHEIVGIGLFIQPHSVMLVTACFRENIFFFQPGILRAWNCGYWTFHTATLNYVSDSLLHGKYLFFNQEYYVLPSVFIGMLARKQFFYSWLFLEGSVGCFWKGNCLTWSAEKLLHLLLHTLCMHCNLKTK